MIWNYWQQEDAWYSGLIEQIIPVTLDLIDNHRHLDSIGRQAVVRFERSIGKYGEYLVRREQWDLMPPPLHGERSPEQQEQEDELITILQGRCMVDASLGEHRTNLLWTAKRKHEERMEGTAVAEVSEDDAEQVAASKPRRWRGSRCPRAHSEHMQASGHATLCSSFFGLCRPCGRCATREQEIQRATIEVLSTFAWVDRATEDKEPFETAARLALQSHYDVIIKYPNILQYGGSKPCGGTPRATICNTDLTVPADFGGSKEAFDWCLERLAVGDQSTQTYTTESSRVACDHEGSGKEQYTKLQFYVWQAACSHAVAIRKAARDAATMYGGIKICTRADIDLSYGIITAIEPQRLRYNQNRGPAPELLNAVQFERLLPPDGFKGSRTEFVWCFNQFHGYGFGKQVLPMPHDEYSTWPQSDSDMEEEYVTANEEEETQGPDKQLCQQVGSEARKTDAWARRTKLRRHTEQSTEESSLVQGQHVPRWSEFIPYSRNYWEQMQKLVPERRLTTEDVIACYGRVTDINAEGPEQIITLGAFINNEYDGELAWQFPISLLIQPEVCDGTDIHSVHGVRTRAPGRPALYPRAPFRRAIRLQ